MRSSVIRNPVRAVFRLTFSICTALPGLSTAAQATNAADDGSPGTQISAECICTGPFTRAVRSPAVVSTPYSGSMSSVWLRDTDGSFSSVTPLAYTPASSTAVFSCADAIGES